MCNVKRDRRHRLQGAILTSRRALLGTLYVAQSSILVSASPQNGSTSSEANSSGSQHRSVWLGDVGASSAQSRQSVSVSITSCQRKDVSSSVSELIHAEPSGFTRTSSTFIVFGS